MKLIILSLISFSAALAFGQSVNTLMGARSTGLAYASGTLADEWSLFNNIGGLAKVKKLSGAFAYEVSPSLPGGNRMAAVLNTPFKFGTAGLGFFRFGDALYNEQVISTGFSNQLGIASLGIKLNYIQYQAEGFGTRSAWSFNFGGVAQLTRTITVGAYITNINQPEIAAQDNERIPTALTAAISFKPVEHVLLVAEVRKDLEYDPTIKGALEYMVHKKVFARTGFNLQPNAGFFGLGFLAKRLKIDYAMQYNNVLGLSHQASVICLMEKKRKNNEQ